ncbi:hypothetical protein VPNG_01424 [Cytospora leucostoma]|uniref:Uncharacterized protein n=1 Tax=Cytospora leucostoma TaxID=1230097 RepID=A0A423XKH7_9PEZI|nr:hypothetical protein VPNG_01424 [Cytospora leucostoma]
MLPTLIRRAAREAKPSNEAWLRRIKELYPPKKVWPPDFKKLSLQEQLKYEKKYKRRLALATARPRWTKFIKLVQLFSVTSVVIYSVLFMDWGTDQQPFDDLRKSLWNAMGLEYQSSTTKPMQKIHTQALPPVK